MFVERHRRSIAWIASCVIAGASTWQAIYLEVSTFGKSEFIQTGLDFSNNTWRAVRDLIAGNNIYATPHKIIPGIGPAWPVSQHVPASLLWQAPFAALPLPAALFAFTFASILAIWAAVFVLIRPRNPRAILLTALCGEFAICLGGGPVTLRLGQPTGFELLGLALVVRSRKPWLAGIGLLLAATTLQTAVPLGLALIVLGNWGVVWRGVVLIGACSVPPVALEIANAGLRGFTYSFTSGATVHLWTLTNRIDLGALLLRLGLAGVGATVAIGILLGAMSMLFLARLPQHLRKIDYPPVLCLVIATCLLSTYHQDYDMLLVGGCMVPVIAVRDRSRAMIQVLVAAAIASTTSSSATGHVLDPVGLVIIGVLSAWAAWQAAVAPAATSAEAATAAHLR